MWYKPLIEESEYSPILVAEIGCNHMGDMAMAKKMLYTAREFCLVDHVKFQKRNPKECLSPSQYAASHPDPYHSYGETYGEHRERLEFSAQQHRELKDECDELGLTYFSSVWDLTSAREIAGLAPKLIKVPSACNTHQELLNYLFDEFAGDIHVSLGMTTRKEEEAVLELARQRGRLGDIVLYACTAGYPVPHEEICLYEITRLRDTYGGHVKAIGFSGHHGGIAADIAAMTLGASWIERHFTLDRTLKGTDHAASLEPDGLRKLRRDLTLVSKSLCYKSNEILPIEEPQRVKLKYSRDKMDS